MLPTPFTGRTVLVTGSSRGLGLLLAREFGRQGANVAICARDPHELGRAAESLKREGIEVFTHACDLADPAAAEPLVAAVVSRFGRLDILVNNAGIIQVGPLESMSLDDFRQIMEVNFWATLRVSLAAIPELKKIRGARIVNITSIGAAMAVPHLLPYSTSKFAQLGFSLGLRAELAKDGIRVISILPGLMRTGSFVNALFKGQRSREFRLFSLSASLPLLTIGAERAARRIVRATRRGEALVTLGVPFRLARIAFAVFPGIGSGIFGFVNRLLPGAGQEEARGEALPGKEVSQRQSWAERAIVGIGRKAADRFNEGKKAG